jgi:3-carboxy-cis,cis-muconate cycloisomerase
VPRSQSPSGSPFQLLSALYSDRAMLDVWSEEKTVSLWLRVESQLALVEVEAGLLLPSEAAAIAEACDVGAIDMAELWKSSGNVGYPILPLVRQITQTLPSGPNGKVHLGATTQDIMDSALAIQLGESCHRLDELVVSFGDALAELTFRHSRTVMAARTHAQQAVPTTFGAIIATFLSELSRGLTHLREVGEDVRYVSLFGAGGTSAALGPYAPRLRRRLAEQLGLCVDTVPWHVSRDRVARYGQIAALLSACCVRFAREIVDLSRTEIAEVREEGGYHRGASSTMPHKANPIFSESIVGLGVTASGLSGLLLRAMEAGHERSAGEWQIEWLVLPQISVYSATSLALASEVAEQLQVFPERMIANMALDEGLLMSESAMMKLATVMGREAAHDLVYEVAADSRLKGKPFWGSLVDALDPSVVNEIGWEQIHADDYVGEAPAIADAAILQWRVARDAVVSSRVPETEVEESLL